MNPIQTWNYKDRLSQLSISLFEDKLSYIRKFQGKILKNEFSIKEMFQRKYPLTSVEFDYRIYKKLAELKQPEDLTEFEIKIRKFWKALDNSKFTEEKFFISDDYFWLKSKLGFAEGYIRRNDNKERLYSWQSIADFFFYGPYKYGISIEDRLRIRQEIYDCLDPSKNNLSLEDSFVIFDYEKIKSLHFKKIEGIKGKYFKIEDGRSVVGGWDNPRDGGENYTSVEHLWYNLNSRVPVEFRNSIPEIKSILESAIVSF